MPWWFREGVDQWTDASGELLGHCVHVAQLIGRAAKYAFDAPRAGMAIAGFEVAHLHVHVFPAWSMQQFDWTTVSHPSGEELDAAARKLRQGLEVVCSR